MRRAERYGSDASGRLAALEPIAAPSAPTNLTVVQARARLILTWDAAVPGQISVGGYAIYRATSTGGQGDEPIGYTRTTEFVAYGQPDAVPFSRCGDRPALGFAVALDYCPAARPPDRRWRVTAIRSCRL